MTLVPIQRQRNINTVTERGATTLFGFGPLGQAAVLDLATPEVLAEGVSTEHFVTPQAMAHVTARAIASAARLPTFAGASAATGLAGVERVFIEDRLANFRRVDIEPDHDFKFPWQDVWFVLDEYECHARHFGILPDGSDVYTLLNKARIYAYKYGDRRLRLGAGTYCVSDTVIVGAGAIGTESEWQNCQLIGVGHAYLNSPKSATVIKWIGANDADKAVVSIEGRISGAEVAGFMIDCAKKARDGLVIKSAYGCHIHDIWAKDYRRTGIEITTQASPGNAWYTSYCRFIGLVATSTHVERSGNYETSAWRISGRDATAGAWGNVYINCRGLAYRDGTNTAWPRAIWFGYTDSSSFLESDFSLAWSSIDADGNVVIGTPGAPAPGRGYGAVFDATIKDQFPTNIELHNCSIVGLVHVIEPGTNKIGDIQYNNQPTKDWESPPTHPRIRGYNDRGHYFGDIPIAIRGDGNRLRFYQQDLARWFDIVMQTTSGGNFNQLLMQYRNAAGVETPALAVNAAGEVRIFQGIRELDFTLAHEAVVSWAPPRTDGVVAVARTGGGIEQSILFGYRVTGTHAIDLIAKGSSSNIEVTLGELVAGSETGTSLKLTFSVDGGKIYIKNRTGPPVTLRGRYVI